MSTALEGMVVVVTGASSGIGRAIALAAGRAGADVLLTYRINEPRAAEVAGAIEGMGRRAVLYRLDLADEASIAGLATAARAAFGRADAWINNAGADIVTTEGDARPRLRKLDLLLQVDLRGSMLASWEAADMMARQPNGGVIINMSWDHVVAGMEGTNPQLYSAVKGGVMSFSKSLARSVAPKVRVNVLAPGWIATAFGENLESERYREVAESTPLKRWGTPEDVARVAVFLASPDAAFLTGQAVNINGGVIM